MNFDGGEWAVVFVALITSVIAPMVLGRVNSASQLRMNAQNWRRQDAVAAKAAEAARLLLAAQQETIKRTDEVAKVAASADKDITKQLSIIHHLVNSELTAARQTELDQTRQLVAALRRIVSFNEHAGVDSTEEQNEIDAYEGHIRELLALLAERKKQQNAADDLALDAAAVSHGHEQQREQVGSANKSAS